MSDHFNLLTVVLAEDVREEVAEPIIKAIGMIQGVISVTSRVVDSADYIAQQRVRHELIEKLFAVLYSQQ